MFSIDTKSPFATRAAFANRRMKPVELAIAAVEPEERVKATACGPCDIALQRTAAVRFNCLVPANPFPAGVGAAFGVGAAQRTERIRWCTHTGNVGSG